MGKKTRDSEDNPKELEHPPKRIREDNNEDKPPKKKPGPGRPPKTRDSEDNPKELEHPPKRTQEDNNEDKPPKKRTRDSEDNPDKSSCRKRLMLVIAPRT